MPRRFMIDTDVLIEYLRGKDQAAKFLESLEGDLIISAISVAELFSGVKGSDREGCTGSVHVGISDNPYRRSIG